MIATLENTVIGYTLVRGKWKCQMTPQFTEPEQWHLQPSLESTF